MLEDLEIAKDEKSMDSRSSGAGELIAFLIILTIMGVPVVVFRAISDALS